MRASFARAPAPVAASVVRERTVREAIAAIRNSEYAGAKAIDLHLSCFDEAYKNAESFKTVMDSTSLPLLALNYNQNYDYSGFEDGEEHRIGLLELGAAAGASAVDLQGYSFNARVKHSFQSEYATGDMLFAEKKPFEVALDPETVAKQTAFIQKMHAQGTEVLLSCHTSVNLNCEETLSLAREFEKRGPDVIKLVLVCDTEEELAEQFRTMIMLKKEIKCAVHMHCNGKLGKVTRVVNPLLGAHLAFCVERYGINALDSQLDLRTYSYLLEHLQWR